ncbi:MAG: hypothetical protein HYU39_10815 [Thaumarchaeota archaeon]|nr:hypothetical protein [Nitrososphaerota archaeon]
MINVKHLSIDDIDSFDKVKALDSKRDGSQTPIYEETFQQGLQKILGEEGTFQDWGGENDDLFSTRMIFRGKRITVAFGLKGKGTAGILTPKKWVSKEIRYRDSSEHQLIYFWCNIGVRLTKVLLSK